MCLQKHHVIPCELGEWLFQNYSLEWDDCFKGKTVDMAQCGSHSVYTNNIREIILQGCPVDNVPDSTIGQYQSEIKNFANKLKICIENKYSGFHPDNIPYSALYECFHGVLPKSSSGRVLKPVK